MLALAVGGLLVGPLFASLSPNGRGWRAWLDGLSLTLVAGVCLLQLLPHAIAHAGPLAAGAAVVGLLAPRWLPRRGQGRGWTGFAFALFLVHALMDGAALGLLGGQLGVTLGVAIAAHRVPVGLVVFQAASRKKSEGGAALGWAAIGALAVATGLGFVGMTPMPLELTGTTEGVLEALVAGAFLHIVFDGPHVPPSYHVHTHPPHGSEEEPVHPYVDDLSPSDALSSGERRFAALGALVGLALVAVIGQLGADEQALGLPGDAASNLLAWSLAGAPALLVGYALASVVAGLFVPTAPTGLAGGGAAFKGVMYGVTRPVCPCDVMPVYESLLGRGVPLAAALGFLLVTPAVGLDGLFLSGVLLGIPLTMARLGGALLLAFGVAWWIGGRAARPTQPSKPGAFTSPQLATRVVRGLRYGFGELLDHTLPWLTVGIVAAAFVEPLLGRWPPGALPSGLQVPLLAAIGLPLYVCASGVTPLAAVAVYKGVPAGAVLAFLLAGSAIHVSSMRALARRHGASLAWRLVGAVFVIAALCGWMVDALDPVFPNVLPDGGEPSVVRIASAFVLAGLALVSLFRQGPRGVVSQLVNPTEAR